MGTHWLGHGCRDIVCGSDQIYGLDQIRFRQMCYNGRRAKGRSDCHGTSLILSGTRLLDCVCSCQHANCACSCWKPWTWRRLTKHQYLGFSLGFIRMPWLYSWDKGASDTSRHHERTREHNNKLQRCSNDQREMAGLMHNVHKDLKEEISDLWFNLDWLMLLLLLRNK